MQAHIKFSSVLFRASRGTCGFTPALLWNNQLDEACDVFGAGCTLCCALVSLLEVHLPAMDRHSPCTFWSDTLVKELENGALPRSNLPAGSVRSSKTKPIMIVLNERKKFSGLIFAQPFAGDLHSLGCMHCNFNVL